MINIYLEFASITNRHRDHDCLDEQCRPTKSGVTSHWFGRLLSLNADDRFIGRPRQAPVEKLLDG